MASIKDIAKITGLSLATVSRVFNNSPSVSPKTRSKVLDAAKQLDYHPNQMAAALRSGKSKIIGVIVPEVNNYFFSSIINGIEKKLTDLGYRIIIAQSHESAENEHKALQSFLNLNVDGILMSISKKTTDYTLFKKIISDQLPIVFFDRIPKLEGINSVTLDDYKGAYIATEHLIKGGCKHLVHIAGDSKVSIFKKRKKGFLDALAKHKHPVNTYTVSELSSNPKKDLELINTLFQLYPTIDGIFVHGDESSLYLMNLLQSLKISIPKQLKLIGFGNANYSELVQPPLSSIDQRCDEMGAIAATILLKHLTKKQTMPQKEILSPKLIIRQSSAN